MDIKRIITGAANRTAESSTATASSKPPVAGPRKAAAPSLISADLRITGDLNSSGDIHVEGVVEGDIRAHQLTIGESATIKGEIVADDVVVHGRVVGRLRGLKVRLTASARVEGDIIHKTIAIESGAHFEGSVQRQDDPIGQTQPARIAGPARSSYQASEPDVEPAS